MCNSCAVPIYPPSVRILMFHPLEIFSGAGRICTLLHFLCQPWSYRKDKVSKRAGSQFLLPPLLEKQWGAALTLAAFWLLGSMLWKTIPCSFLVSWLSSMHPDEVHTSEYKNAKYLPFWKAQPCNPRSFTSTRMLALCTPFSSVNIPLNACKHEEKWWTLPEDMAVQNSSFEQVQVHVDAVINEEHILT